MDIAGQEFDVYSVPLDKIWVDKTWNCRKNDYEVEKLAEDMVDGLLIPIVIQPAHEVKGVPDEYDYRLVAGFRRFSAAQVLEWEKIPANVRVGLTEHQAKILNFMENAKRKNLTIVEEADYINEMYPFNISMKSIAQDLGETEYWVRTRRKLGNLPNWIKDAITTGRLNSTQVSVLIHAPNPEAQAKMYMDGMRIRNQYTHNKLKKRSPRKKQVITMINYALKVGLDPELCRLMSYCIGEISEEECRKSIQALAERRDLYGNSGNAE